MARVFDPYYKWLGIPPDQQPADHYRLLGIQKFESDPEVIQAAADQRMAHLRNYQTGQHADLSQRLLNEVAAARVCLLNVAKKIGYDAKLRAAAEKESAATGTPERTLPGAHAPRDDSSDTYPLQSETGPENLMEMIDELPAPSLPRYRPRLRYRRWGESLPLGKIIGGMVAVGVLLIAGHWIYSTLSRWIGGLVNPPSAVETRGKKPASRPPPPPAPRPAPSRDPARSSARTGNLWDSGATDPT